MLEIGGAQVRNSRDEDIASCGGRRGRENCEEAEGNGARENTRNECSRGRQTVEKSKSLRLSTHL